MMIPCVKSANAKVQLQHRFQNKWHCCHCCWLIAPLTYFINWQCKECLRLNRLLHCPTKVYFSLFVQQGNSSHADSINYLHSEEGKTKSQATAMLLTTDYIFGRLFRHVSPVWPRREPGNTPTSKQPALSWGASQLQSKLRPHTQWAHPHRHATVGKLGPLPFTATHSQFTGAF